MHQPGKMTVGMDTVEDVCMGQYHTFLKIKQHIFLSLATLCQCIHYTIIPAAYRML